MPLEPGRGIRMLLQMGERVRMIIDTTDTIRRAVQLRRVKLGGTGTLSEVVNAILQEALAEEIAEVERYDAPKTKKPKDRRAKPDEG
jgi:hypothetical protein